MKAEAPKPVLLRDYRPPNYLIDSVDLDISLHPTETRVRSRLKMRPNPAAKGKPGALVLDGEHLTLEKVRLSGRVLESGDYELTDTALTLPRVPREAFTLEIVTTCDPEANKALTGLYRSRGIYCTQCEAEGFRRITYFLDRPDVLSKYTTRIEADANETPILLGNGNPVDSGKIDGGKRHFAVWRDPFPKPCYLFAMVGGNLVAVTSTFKTMSGRKVGLGIYVEPGKEDRCDWAMDSLKRSMRWDEVKFGREYDLDVFNIVAVSDFNMGAMENKGLNIFNDRLVLASPKTATDGNFADIERVIAHEYFHNWTGNRITCRDWFQLCLKEGLTVYRDQEFTADERSRTVQRIQDARGLKARQFPEDAGPLAHPVRPDSYIEINNFYTSTVYEKGAELVRMIATLLGRDDFRKGMDLYFKRHDGEAATVEEFVTCFADASGRDLKQFMTWYSQAGTPELVCSVSYDAGKKTAELTVEQMLPPTPREPKKKPLHIPLRLGLIGGNGQDVTLKLSSGEEILDGVVELRKRSETFRFVDVPLRPVPSLLRGFSAPVNLTVNLSDADLEFQMANDGDLFNRWQAAQDYATRILVASTKAIREGERTAAPTVFARALGSTLADEGLEPAYRAQMLMLPSESDIARVIARNVEPTAIHRARRSLRRQLGTLLGERLADVYREHAQPGPYSPDSRSAGRRALRNAALGLLTARGRPEDIKRTAQHFRSAGNATDEITALALLIDVRSPERQAALDAFYERWKDDHIVVDHWFTLQAISSLPNTLTTVQRLMTHPLFSLRNPNKARSLIGAFAASNGVNFNRADGKGYAFVADQVLAIDAFNPQIAARMLGSFRSWRTLEPERRKLARAALQRVKKAPKLSRDSGEIVSKMLE
ncbi:MAG: aminopeptidase N [Hyphomicrobiaceae bacterium]